MSRPLAQLEEIRQPNHVFKSPSDFQAAIGLGIQIQRGSKIVDTSHTRQLKHFGSGSPPLATPDMHIELGVGIRHRQSTRKFARFSWNSAESARSPGRARCGSRFDESARARSTQRGATHTMAALRAHRCCNSNPLKICRLHPISGPLSAHLTTHKDKQRAWDFILILE